MHALYEFGHRPPRRLMRWVFAFKEAFGIERLNILPKLIEWNLRRKQRRPLSPRLRSLLLAEFSNDIDLLSELLKRDLSHWKTP